MRRVLFAVLLWGAALHVHAKGLVAKELTAPEIINNFDTLQASEATTPKKFPRSTLGIVTPWNNPEGLQFAETWAKKFTYISPFWFHIQPQRAATEECATDATDKGTCGGQDNYQIRVNPVGNPSKDFVREVKKHGAQVVPVFAFYGWTQETLSVFFFGEGSGDAQHRVVRAIVEACISVECDGVHIEWGPMPVKEYYKKLEGWLRRLRGTMRKLLGHSSQSLLLSVHANPALFAKENFEALLPTVDKFVLHLYNFTGPALAEGPGTPISWFTDMLTAWNLLKRDDADDRVLATIPFFGREFRYETAVDLDAYQEHMKPVDGDGDMTRWDLTGKEYINALRQAETSDMHFEWKKDYEEHRVTWEAFKKGTDGKELTVKEQRSIWYPTLLSLNKRIELLKKTRACGLGIYNLGAGLEYFFDLI
eukprot:Hpha_TRINITY_DN10219_c0_g1::TRINITY_DN10219_c0_g1_i1::g.35071::m.35071/K17525/CHID1; chitinase domain-containing protein 1